MKRVTGSAHAVVAREDAVVCDPDSNVSKLKRSLALRPGHFGRDSQGAELSMMLRGPAGAIDFVTYTGWLPRFDSCGEADTLHKPGAAWISFHWRTPLWRGHHHTPKKTQCSVFRRCYFDKGSLIADPVFRTLVAEGSEAAWAALEQMYRETALLGRPKT